MLDASNLRIHFDISEVGRVDLGEHVTGIKALKSLDRCVYVACDTSDKSDEIVVIKDGKVVRRYAVEGFVWDIAPSPYGEVIAAIHRDKGSEIVQVNGKVEPIMSLEGEVTKVAYDWRRGTGAEEPGKAVYANVFSQHYQGHSWRGRGGVVIIDRKFKIELHLRTSGRAGSVDDLLFDGSKAYALVVPDYPASHGAASIEYFEEDSSASGRRASVFADLNVSASRIASDGTNMYAAIHPDPENEDNCRIVRVSDGGKELTPVSDEFWVENGVLDLSVCGRYIFALCQPQAGGKFTEVILDGTFIPFDPLKRDFIVFDGQRFYNSVKQEGHESPRELAVFEVAENYIVPAKQMEKLLKA